MTDRGAATRPTDLAYDAVCLVGGRFTIKEVCRVGIDTGRLLIIDSTRTAPKDYRQPTVRRLGQGSRLHVQASGQRSVTLTVLTSDDPLTESPPGMIVIGSPVLAGPAIAVLAALALPFRYRSWRHRIVQRRAAADVLLETMTRASIRVV